MLSSRILTSIHTEATEYWRDEFRKPEILGIAKGKEIGHRLADLVDEKTTALLTVNYLTKHQRDAQGRKRSRSMGDIWLWDNGIYHPVNVKTGIIGSDWLEYVTFDSGPGQLMLKAVKFFNEFDPTAVKPTTTIKDKVRRLMDLYEDGERRLKENREKDLDDYRRHFEAFMIDNEIIVTPETQESLNLQ